MLQALHLLFSKIRVYVFWKFINEQKMQKARSFFSKSIKILSKILKNLLPFFVTSKQSRVFFQIFVAFSECLNSINLDLPICFIIIFLFQMSTFEITVVLQQGQQFGTALRSWFGLITNGTKSVQVGPHYSLRKKDLYTTSARSETVTFHSSSFKSKTTSHQEISPDYFLKNRNFLPTYKSSYKVLSHDLSTKKNGTLLSVIYVILLIILIVKDVNQTSSIFCNSNLSSKNQKKIVNLP